MKIIPVILSGGSGTRLWPVSRKYHPKQFLSLIGGKSMFQETILRLDGLGRKTKVDVFRQGHVAKSLDLW